jgi:hypothetical protein
MNKTTVKEIIQTQYDNYRNENNLRRRMKNNLY